MTRPSIVDAGATLGALVVRADAGRGRGHGHVLRQLALAQAWSRRGGTVTLVTVRPPPTVTARWQDEGAEVLDLDECPAARLLEVALERAANWVSLDGYHLGAPQDRLREQGLRVLVVDDHGGMGACQADVIVDQNVGASPEDYADRPNEGLLLLGTRYALLRRQFMPSAGWQRIVPERPRTILVTLGGAPPAGPLALIRDAVTSAFPDAERVELVDESDDNRIVDLLTRSDVAVSASGSTAWELCLMRVPTAYVAVADNQRPVARRLAEIGCALDLGNVRDLEMGRLTDALRRLSEPGTRSAMASRCAGLVDGRGASRIVTALQAELLEVRRATGADAELLFGWRNDPAARSWSFNPAELTWEEHLAWLHRRLTGADCVIYVVSAPSGPPIGQVRFDRAGDGSADSQISLSLDASARGHGLGAALIRAGLRRYRSDAGIGHIEARVKPGNIASVASLDLAGFVPHGDAVGDGLMVRYGLELA